MSAYKYHDPVDKGYVKFKLSKKQHNEIFKYRQIKWNERYDYYYNDEKIIMHKLTNRKAVVMCTLFFPIAIIFEGLINIKEAWMDLKKLYNQKEYGSFVSEHVWKKEQKYKQIMDIVEIQVKLYK